MSYPFTFRDGRSQAAVDPDGLPNDLAVLFTQAHEVTGLANGIFAVWRIILRQAYSTSRREDCGGAALNVQRWGP